MINADNAEVDIDEMRLWANEYRTLEDGDLMPLKSFANECGIPEGTLGPWLAAKYTGRNDRVAKKMFQFRQQIIATAKHSEALPIDPGFFDTPTSTLIERILTYAHMGRITLGGLGPGTGKTITAREYQQKAGQVFIATMKPSTKRVLQMIMEVHKALGLEPRYMMAAQASREVIKRLERRKALLVIDEANHLTIEAIEEIRSWHDETDCGICFLGNGELVRRIESGKQKEQFARLNSRIAYKIEVETPSEEDVKEFCDAWGIRDLAIRKFLKNIGTSRDAGGLRECRQLVEIATLIAADEQRGLTLDDLKEAQQGRASKWIKA